MTNYEGLKKEMEKYFGIESLEIFVLRNAIEMAKNADDWRASLTERERFILENCRFERHFCLELTDIAQELDITREKARKIRSKAFKKILYCYSCLEKKTE